MLDHLGHLSDDLSSRDLPVRWVAPNALHLTLHFIGKVPIERAELLRMSFANLTLKTGHARLVTGTMGIFPNQKRPRVIWIGLEGVKPYRLSELYRTVGSMLDRIDLPTEDRSFRPHLTLGRARDTVDQLFPYQLGKALQSPTSEKSSTILSNYSSDLISIEVTSKNLAPATKPWRRSNSLNKYPSDGDIEDRAATNAIQRHTFSKPAGCRLKSLLAIRIGCRPLNIPVVV